MAGKIQVMTANRLGDGEVVYLAEGGRWSEWLAESQLARDAAAAEALEATAAAAVKARQVVLPYLIPVEVAEDGGIAALSQRERIRAKGPTVHPAFGKQAREPEAFIEKPGVIE
ncbi:MAG: DUF2849 domain-containing protein [Acetobacterales bacterium]